MNENNPRQFKGVWIPAELWMDKNLTWLHKCLIAEIDSLSTKDKPCFASDAYLAEMFGVSLGRMQHLIMEVKKAGYVKTLSFNGRQRALVVTFNSGAELSKSDSGGGANSNSAELSKSDSPESSPIISRDTSLVTSVEQPEKTPTLQGVIATIKAWCNKRFNRLPNDPWSYLEEQTLVDVSKRPSAINELHAIARYAESANGYFPKSLEALLLNWTKTLDQARNTQGPHMSLTDLRTQRETIAEIMAKHPGNPKSDSYNPGSKEIDHLKADLSNLRKQYATINTQILRYGQPTATA